MSGNSINYREGHESDLVGVLALSLKAQEEQFPDADYAQLKQKVHMYAERTPLGPLWVAEHSGKLIGVARGEWQVNVPLDRLEPNGPVAGCTAYLDELYVRPGYRSRGVARKLLELIMSEFWKKGVVAVWGAPSKPNMRHLYASYGASEVQMMRVTRSDYRDKRHDAAP